MNLLLAQCVPQSSALPDGELADWLAQVPGWLPDATHKAIARRFTFDNYYQVMAFANAVAEIAHAQDHHPDVVLSFNVATVSYSTHSVQGLSVNDFICAAQVNALPEAQP